MPSHVRSVAFTVFTTVLACSACDGEKAPETSADAEIAVDTGTSAALPTVCDIGDTRCADDGAAVETCSDDRTAWVREPCGAGQTCQAIQGTCVAPPKKVCEPGVRKCAADGSVVSLCKDDGTAAEVVEDCGLPGLCDPDTLSCKPPFCEPDSERCSDGVHEVCDAGTAWVEVPCAQGLGCQAITGGCAAVVCQPGILGCAADFTALAACSDDQLQVVATPCAPDETCTDGACVPSNLTLGDVAWLSPGGKLQIHAGRYAVLVADTSLSGPELRALPLELAGSSGVPSGNTSPLPPHPLTEGAAPSSHAVRCGTTFVVPTLATPGADLIPDIAPAPAPPPAVGDKKTFYFSDKQNGGTVTPRTGRLRDTSDRVNVWEDTTDHPTGTLLTDSAATAIRAPLEDQSIDRLEAIFGPMTDVDGNGRVDIFVTDQLTWAGGYMNSGAMLPPDQVKQPFDHGEVIYISRDPFDPDFNPSSWNQAIPGTLAHELQHLLYYGRRWPAAMKDPYTYGFGPAYQIEGLAELGMFRSGVEKTQFQSWAALTMPDKLSARALLEPEYVTDPETNAVGYALGGLVFEYLFHQSGGIVVLGLGDDIQDEGGLSFVDAFSDGPDALDRLEPTDGRSLTQWWPDFGAALLLSTLIEDAHHALSQDPHYAMPPRVKDPYGGFTGPALAYKSVPASENDGPLLKRQSWADRPAMMRSGGLVFLDLVIGDGELGTLSLATGSGRAAVVRYGGE